MSAVGSRRRPEGKKDGSETTATAAAAAAAAAPFASAASVADIRAVLTGQHERAAALTGRLRTLVAGDGERLGRELARLDGQRATLGAQELATGGLGSTASTGLTGSDPTARSTGTPLAAAAATAGRLSSTVRTLDLEKARVEATLRVVEQVAELKACVAGVVGSMGAPQDWEAAAGYLARASRIPAAIVASGFTAAVVPTVEVPDPPAATLEEARASLSGLFLREFERAAGDGDDARVTRFFKLFPLIGRTDAGLDVYGRYVCQGVASSARAVLAAAPTPTPPFFYANALAKLFAHISQIVDGHGPLVERHYGPGHMGRVVARLQAEADVQGGILLDTWADDRAVDRRLTDVKSYPFSFLVQSFLAQQRGGGGGGMAAALAAAPRVNSPAFGARGGGGSSSAADSPDLDGASPRPSEDEGVSMKDVDGLLSEMAVMLGRWALYARFLSGQGDSPPLPPVIAQSNLQRKMAARLVAPYNLMSTFFFRRSVEKAFQLDEMPADLSLVLSRPIDNNPPYILSAVDDVMYIANAVIQKALSTLQRDVVVGVVPPVGRILGADFIGMIQRKMRDEAYPKAAVSGGFPPEDKIIAFVVLINSLDMAVEYLARIVSSRMGVPADEGDAGASAGVDVGSAAQTSAASVSVPVHGPQPQVPSATAPAVVAHLRESFPFAHEAAAVATALAGLHASFAVTAAELLAEGLQVLFHQVVKARLRPVLADTFRDADYALDEAELAVVAEQNDEDVDVLLEQVPRRFARGWEALMRPLARLLTPRTLATLADLAAQYLARVLEKRVWGYAGRASAYGAIRMERDMNAVVSTVARGNYAARELFGKTTQILMVANMEDDEWEELGGGNDDGGDDDGMVWQLTADERRRARGIVRR